MDIPIPGGGDAVSYRLHRHQVVAGTLPEVWAFFKEPRNLESITPHRRWYHRHRFSPVEGGVAIEDLVEYELPLGALGRIVHTIAVRRQLEKIFDYRTQRIALRYPNRTVSASAVVPG